MQNCYKNSYYIWFHFTDTYSICVMTPKWNLSQNFPSWININLHGTMLTLAHRRYLNPPRVVRHYNNVIAIIEKKCYKITRDRTWRVRGPIDSEASRRGLESARRPMAAATSAAISMKMLWMSAILYDKISPQKRLSKPNQLSYPANILVRKESENLSKNQCTLHRESSISLPFSPTLRCKEKGNAQNLVKHSNYCSQEFFRSHRWWKVYGLGIFLNRCLTFTVYMAM